MKWVKLTLALVICIPLGAVSGALYNFDHGERQVYIGMGAGAFIGLVLGLAFGGVERVATFLYGPKQEDDSDNPAGQA